MLARCTRINHPSGAVIDLPRLVPAFSSKGFDFFSSSDEDLDSVSRSHKLRRAKPVSERKRDLSETTRALELMAPHIKDSILVSAYDLHHRYFREPTKFLRNKELVFLDSGGYELSPEFDQTEPVQRKRRKETFTEANYRAVLNGMPKEVPLAVSNYDWGTRLKSVIQQILAAQDLFRTYPHFLKNFIVKPGLQRYLEIDEIIRHVKKLAAFDIIGVTEKELGRDLLDRLTALARLRNAMDRENITLPIHVWGGLDPIHTPLYFLAGAEIFDGISWLRYAYLDGVAVYRDSYIVITGNIETSFDESRTLAMTQNLQFLRRLATNFRDFVLRKGTSFEMFGPRAKPLENAYRALVTRVPAIEGGH